MKNFLTSLFSLIFIFGITSSGWADELTPVATSVTMSPQVTGISSPAGTQVADRKYDIGLHAQIYWVMIQMTFDQKNKWVYEKELSDCYVLLGDTDKAQEELKASLADNPNGVAAPAATVAKIRRHRRKALQSANPTPEAVSADSTPTEEATAAPTEETTPEPTKETTPSPDEITPTPFATPAPTSIGSLTLGAYMGLWNVNYAAPTNGTEIMFPMSASVKVSSDLAINAASNYLIGAYQYLGGDTLNLANFSDTTLAAQFGFKTMDLDTVLSETFNIPTGNPSWTAQSSNADLPTFLVDPRYSAGAFSFSTVYGLSVPVDASKCSIGVGYVFNTDYNPNAGLPTAAAADVLPGNSLFFNLNRVTPTGDGQSDTFQASIYFSFATLENGAAFTCPGPNINFSYAWSNPTGFSFELGSQFYLPGQTAVNGVLTPDPTYALGPRLYLKPSLVMDDLTLAGQVKFILPNGYDPSDLSCVPGGLLLSVGPSYNLKMDSQPFLTIAATYNFIDNIGGGFDDNGNRIDVLYNWFTCMVNHSFQF